MHLDIRLWVRFIAYGGAAFFVVWPAGSLLGIGRTKGAPPKTPSGRRSGGLLRYPRKLLEHDEPVERQLLTRPVLEAVLLEGITRLTGSAAWGGLAGAPLFHRCIGLFRPRGL